MKREREEKKKKVNGEKAMREGGRGKLLARDWNER